MSEGTLWGQPAGVGERVCYVALAFVHDTFLRLPGVSVRQQNYQRAAGQFLASGCSSVWRHDCVNVAVIY